MIAPQAALTFGSSAILGSGIGVFDGFVVRRLAGNHGPLPPWGVVALQGGLAVWAVACATGPYTAFVSILLSAALLILMLVDIAEFRLPDVITLPLTVAGLSEAVLGPPDLMARIIGALAGWGSIAGLAVCFRRLRGRDGIGMGDAKLLAGAGAWLGWRLLPWTVLLACGAAFVIVGLRALRQGRSSVNQPLPFGAPLALAIWLAWLYGAPQP